VTERIPKSVVLASIVVGALALVYFAYSRPGYFTSQTYTGGLLLLEVLAAALWMYRRVFFPLIVVTFLLAGMDLPIGSIWTSARWLVLGVGATVGLAIFVRDRRFSFGLFHVIALFAVLAALVSAAVSRYTSVSFSKVLSLFLLFLYAGTGARLAVAGRENRFFSGLLTGCEVFVAGLAVTYILGMAVMGNPNSLGAVAGVAAAPILLWGTLIQQQGSFANRRRLLMYAIAMYLTFASHARASMLAALVSCGLLCLALRKYRLLGVGIGILAIIVASMAILRPEAFSRMISSATSTFVYKGKDPNEGLLASRQSPWQNALDSIHDHFWFGTGFGTSDNGRDATEDLGKFSTNSASSSEHGSSYLAITTWVGMAGVLPFLLLLLLILVKIGKVVVWMFRTQNPLHPAIPLAMVLLAGLIHASLEDWLFAPGYYLCVFFWSMAFVLADYTPSLTIDAPYIVQWRSKPRQPEFEAIAPSA
jgi:O-antigen ligase